MKVDYNNLPEALEYLINEVSELKHLLLNSVYPELDPNERLTRKEVKIFYKISYGTIHSAMKKGKLVYSKIGRKTLFKRIDLENWMNGKQYD